MRKEEERKRGERGNDERRKRSSSSRFDSISLSISFSLDLDPNPASPIFITNLQRRMKGKKKRTEKKREKHHSTSKLEGESEIGSLNSLGYFPLSPLLQASRLSLGACTYIFHLFIIDHADIDCCSCCSCTSFPRCWSSSR